MAKLQAEELLEKLEFLLQGYSLERRATTQPFLFDEVRTNIPNYTYHPDDRLIRETLIEHVGSLPIVATAIFPYINDPEIDLGQALTMLAIHDIGELMVGDESVFTKKPSTVGDTEHQAALKILHPSYHSLYEDMEYQGSTTARFAKAIDKITPDLFDYLTPADITIQRFKHFCNVEANEIIGLIIKHKRPYMLWNPFMAELHEFLIGQTAKKLKQA
jgi:hypothetical protein